VFRLAACPQLLLSSDEALLFAADNLQLKDQKLKEQKGDLS